MTQITFFFFTYSRRSLIIKNANVLSILIQKFNIITRSTISKNDHEFSQNINFATLNDENIIELTREISKVIVQEFQIKFLFTSALFDEKKSIVAKKKIALNRFNIVDAQIITISISINDELTKKIAIFFDNVDNELANTFTTKFEKFIASYVKYNIVNNYYLDRHYQRNSTNNIFDDFVRKYCIINDSRD